MKDPSAGVKLYRIAFRDGMLSAAKIIAEGFQRPGIVKKQDKCAHDKFGWEDCEQCCVEEIKRVTDIVTEEEDVEENDFIIAIQAILTKAKKDGWPLERVVDTATQAIEEFEVEEFGKPDGGDPEDEYE